MLRLGAQRAELGIVADQRGCPTYAGDLAVAVKTVLEHLLAGKGAAGVYHFCGNQEVSWYQFALEIFKQAAANGVLAKLPLLRPLSTADYPTPAKRPAYSVLDCQKITAHFGVSPSDWKSKVSRV